MAPATSSSETQGSTLPATAAVAPGKSTSRGRRAAIPKLKKRTVVRIEWVDAVTELGPRHSDDDFPCPTRYTVGHFIKRTDTAISIAMEDDSEAGLGESDCQTVTSIPIGMIKNLTVFVPKS